MAELVEESDVFEGSRFDRCRWYGCDAGCVDEIELCWYHYRLAGETFVEKRSIWGAAAMKDRRERREREDAKHNAKIPSHEDWCRSRSVVYYVQLPRYVKIGYTIHLPERIGQYRLGKDVLLAVEPGWREMEKTRHEQFAAERPGRREDFNPSRRLLAHIDALRHQYGEPWAYAKRRRDGAGPMPIPRNQTA